MQRYLSFGYLATIIGGLLLAAGSMLSLTIAVEPFSAKVVTGAFAASSAIRLLGAAGMIIGLTAVYVRESARAGTFGLLAYTVVIVNLVLQAGWMWADTFVSGVLAVNAPGVLNGTSSDSRMDAAFMVAWLMNSSFILLGIATLRARVFGRAVGGALLVMGIVTLVPLPFDGPVYEVIIGTSCAVAGIFARRVTPVASVEGVAPPSLVTN